MKIVDLKIWEKESKYSFVFDFWVEATDGKDYHYVIIGGAKVTYDENDYKEFVGILRIANWEIVGEFSMEKDFGNEIEALKYIEDKYAFYHDLIYA